MAQKSQVSRELGTELPHRIPCIFGEYSEIQVGRPNGLGMLECLIGESACISLQIHGFEEAGCCRN